MEIHGQYVARVNKHILTSESDPCPSRIIIFSGSASTCPSQVCGFALEEIKSWTNLWIRNTPPLQLVLRRLILVQLINTDSTRQYEVWWKRSYTFCAKLDLWQWKPWEEFPFIPIHHVRAFVIELWPLGRQFFLSRTLRHTGYHVNTRISLIRV